jgi:hypothetical protein
MERGFVDWGVRSYVPASEVCRFARLILAPLAGCVYIVLFTLNLRDGAAEHLKPAQVKAGMQQRAMKADGREAVAGRKSMSEGRPHARGRTELN